MRSRHVTVGDPRRPCEYAGMARDLVSTLKEACDCPPGKLRDVLPAGSEHWDFGTRNVCVASREQALLVVRLLKRFPLSVRHDRGMWNSTLTDALSLMSGVKDPAAVAVMKKQGVAELLRIFDESARTAPKTSRGRGEQRRGFLFALSLALRFHSAEAVPRVVFASRHPWFRADNSWSDVFSELVSKTHPLQHKLVAALSEPLPEGLAAASFCDLCTYLSVRKLLRQPHPFASPAGLKRLEAWLTTTQPDERSYGRSACEALPFIEKADGERLTRLIETRGGHARVSLARCRAKARDREGVNELARLCLDPIHHLQAAEYLAELKQESRVPRESRSEAFQALVIAAFDVEHDFKCILEDFRVIDARYQYWPPDKCGAATRLYEYRFAKATKTRPATGVGMTRGEYTERLLPGVASSELSPEENYALFCAAELIHSFGGAKEISIAEGMRILRKHNKNYGKPGARIRRLPT